MGNYSKQREEILNVIRELYNHPTAEEIYFLVKQKDPAVSRSTVYRNLNVLVNRGIVNQIAISGGPDRYDYIEGREKHGYIICKKCGYMYDFSYDANIEKVQKNISKQTGMKIFEDGMLVKGICNSCIEAEN